MCNTAMRGGEVRILKWKKGKMDTTSKRKSYSYLNNDLTKICIYFKGSYGEIPIPPKLKNMFEELKKIGMDMGFRHVEAGPLVRSSYRADKLNSIIK